MSVWKHWAKTALAKMDDPSWTIRDDDRDRDGGEAGARDALQQVAAFGSEPYYTLKAFVCRNDLEETT